MEKRRNKFEQRGFETRGGLGHDKLQSVPCLYVPKVKAVSSGQCRSLGPTMTSSSRHGWQYTDYRIALVNIGWMGDLGSMDTP